MESNSRSFNFWFLLMFSSISLVDLCIYLPSDQKTVELHGVKASARHINTGDNFTCTAVSQRQLLPRQERCLYPLLLLHKRRKGRQRSSSPSSEGSLTPQSASLFSPAFVSHLLTPHVGELRPSVLTLPHSTRVRTSPLRPHSSSLHTCENFTPLSSLFLTLSIFLQKSSTLALFLK